MNPIASVEAMVLSAVRVVAACYSIDGLRHVLFLVNEYLDTSVSVSIEEACMRGYPRLVVHLLARCQSQPDSHYLATVCNLGITNAATAGNLDVIVSFVRCFPEVVITHAAIAAAANGHTHVLSWLYDRGALVSWTSESIRVSVVNRKLPTLRWFSSRFPITSDPSLLLDAVASGDIAIAQYLWLEFVLADDHDLDLSVVVSRAPLGLAYWMCSNTLLPLVLSIDWAATRGDLGFLRWAQSKGAVASTKSMDGAARNGHLDVVVWLHDNRTEGCSQLAIDEAAAGGFIQVVAWLVASRLVRVTPRTLFSAAVGGHLAVLKYLLVVDTAVVCPPTTFDRVCEAGHLHIAKFLAEVGIGGGSTDALQWAAANGHECVVDWLLTERRMVATEAALVCAAGGGFVGVVSRLLDSSQVDGSDAAVDRAASNGHLAVVKYLQRRLGVSGTVDAFHGALRCGAMEMVLWLDRVSPWICHGQNVDEAMASGNLELVLWLLNTRGGTYTSAGMDAAAGGGHFSLLVHLNALGAASCTTEAFVAALRSGNLYLAGWIACRFPSCADFELLRSHAALIGWNVDMLRVVFGV
jgi:hypothetical protein